VPADAASATGPLNAKSWRHGFLPPPLAATILSARKHGSMAAPDNRKHAEDRMINWSLDADTVTHSIQLALAPVFFLTAVAGMIGAVAGRLARIIDRARKLEELLRNPQEEDFIARSLTELHFLRKRGRLANVCIGLLTVCGFCIGLTIALLFLGEAYGINGHGYAVLGFLFGVLMFLSALACFLWETIMATSLLDFHTLTRVRAAVRTIQRPERNDQAQAEPSAPADDTGRQP